MFIHDVVYICCIFSVFHGLLVTVGLLLLRVCSPSWYFLGKLGGLGADADDDFGVSVEDQIDDLAECVSFRCF